MKFVKELTDAAESLRHIDPSLRKEALRTALQRVQEQYTDVYFPITRDYGAMPRIIRVCAEEGAVFRSKARVPVLVCFEVIRPVVEEGQGQGQDKPPLVPQQGGLQGQQLRPRRTSSMDYVSEEEVDTLIDRGAFHERMNSLTAPRPGELVAPPPALTESMSLTGGSAGLDSTLTVDLTLDEMTSSGTMVKSLSSPSLARVASTRSPITPGGVGGGHEYANKDEVLRMVLTRRRKMGHGLRRKSEVPSAAASSSGELEVEEGGQEATAEGQALNLAKLIQQYEESCSMDDSQSRNISPAVASAIEEYKKGRLSEKELEMLVAKDRKFREHMHETSILDVQFFVSLAFGESWANKKARVKASSADGGRPGWDLLSMIVKSNDDLRQEVCMVQLIELCRDIFLDAGLELWLEPYGIISTTSSTGMIETLTDALSLDALKKKEGYVSLARHFEVSYGHDKARLAQAKRNFISSLAAYSLVCYAFQIKDRHNGNILLDTEGHVVHIDYGFILGIAPGGSFRSVRSMSVRICLCASLD
jgi:hypothetical protein